MPKSKHQQGQENRSEMNSPVTDQQVTIAEHLQVQWEIEDRARRFWFANGCAKQNALNDWIKAEDEVLREFINARMQHHPVPSAPKVVQSKAEETGSWLPVIRPQHAAMSKLESTSTLQPSL